MFTYGNFLRKGRIGLECAAGVIEALLMRLTGSA